jgi:hypothetical protein
MARRGDREYSTDLLPPLLIRIVEAAEQTAAQTDNRKEHAAALAAFGEWALTTVPARGVLAPASDADYQAIEKIADRHLKFDVASRAFRNALAVVRSSTNVDELESAENWVRAVSDNAYYYAGLAAGVVLADLSVRR